MGWLHRHTEVLAKTVADDGRVTFTVRVDPHKVGGIRARFAGGIDQPDRPRAQAAGLRH
jgi:hypothetical protein